MLLLNPRGTRHLSFKQSTGTWWRLWQQHPAEPLSADRAALLRPSDIDVIIKISVMWITTHPGHQRADDLLDEIARGAKAIVVHFAGLAGAR
jgi:hypothetical protein